MVKRIKTYKELKAVCTLHDINLLEFPKNFGYKSLWGFRYALEKSVKKNELWNKVNDFFLKKQMHIRIE